MATEEDKDYQIDYKARLFKAKTWEEIKMFAEKNEYLQEAAQSVYVANADDLVRQKCRAREEAERHERTLKRNIKKLQEENSSLQEKNSSLQEKNSSLQEKNSSLQEEISLLQKENSSKDAYIAQLEARVGKK